MTPEKWQKFDEIFDQVVELPDFEREKILAEKCGTDAELLREIKSLLQADEKAAKFIETSAIKVVAQNLAKEKKSFQNNDFSEKLLDHYKIEKLIGEGGMGKVYLAFDEKLKRQVAVKILPDEFSADDERVNRFQLEARAISALNHPNIVTIYDVGSFKNVHYIATEFVKGKTLRDCISQKIGLKEALNIIVQCCDALSAAHTAGIIHRDIKPENIVVRPDGYVKVLDFGLAKLLQRKGESEKGKKRENKSTISASPHLPISPSPHLSTTPGLIIGTPAYMSPDQLSDNEIDHRTDLWSIGLVLYELITGTNPFKQKSIRRTFQAILSDEPPLASSLNSEISPELDQILIKVLQKDADLGYQTAADLRDDLMIIKHEFDSSSLWSASSEKGRMRERQRVFLIFTFAFLLFTSLFAVWYFYFRESQFGETDWTKARSRQLTSQAGSEVFPNLSHDGESFVFAAKTEGNFDIFLQQVSGKNAANLTKDSIEDDTHPAFSPDEKHIAFRSERSGGGIFIMEATGKNPRKISDFGFHPSWSPDGKQIAVSEKGYERPSTRDKSALWIINLENGEKRKLIENFANQPAWSPAGQRIAFWFIQSGGRRDVATISVTGGEPTLVTNSANTNWNPVWSPDGKYLYYASDQNGNMAFWRVRIDEFTGEVLGEAKIFPTYAKFNSHLSFSKDGKRLIYVQTNNQSNIKAVEFDETLGKIKGEPFWITRGDYEFIRPRLSPDGKEFVVNLARQTQDDIVLINREGKNPVDLTNDEHFDRYPRWSPDGKQIAFASDRSGVYEIWMMNSDGTNLRQITSNRESATSFPIWSPDGKRLSYHIGIETYLLDLTKDVNNQTPEKLPLFNDIKYLVWDWSPDGEKLAGNWGDYEGNAGIGYVSLETNEYTKITYDKSEFPLWLSDSKRLIWTSQGAIYIADSDSKKTEKLLSLPEEVITSVGVSSDRRLLYFTVSSSESNIWLIDATQNQ